MSSTPNTFPDISCLSCAGKQKTEVAGGNFNVYAINSTAIVFITNEFFCVAMPAATARLLNISSFFGYIPFRKKTYSFQHLGIVVSCEAINVIALNSILFNDFIKNGSQLKTTVILF